MSETEKICSKCNGLKQIKKTGVRENDNCEEFEVEYWIKCPNCNEQTKGETK